MPSGKRWSWTITSGVLALVLAGCHYHYETPRPTQFTPVNVDIVAVDSIVKYGRSLVYDSVYGAADSQRVDFATGLIGSGDCSWSPTASRRVWPIPSPTRRPTRRTQAMSGASRSHGGAGVSGVPAVAAPVAPRNSVAHAPW